ncbi:OLC1v1016539C1 [Oldenlandia corymbosa var. corymbosa]|uniref:OLC1v1016539C1 n=1 Tax=Oldenlandia corymbosa var. corymbosa TaxID=529605 RepID=A0AAV1E7I2_OLDCO|nr:OLC1v1016539C1 [Oldenlandia corymbosa var. corymbosa]
MEFGGELSRVYMPPGSEPFPKGFIAKTSNLERRPLWGSPKKLNSSRSLFALAIGIKQKVTVDKMVQKFLESNFAVMLFYYDGIVDGWKDFEWNDRVIHISALNQTKWWFTKRFLHPDIVADYDFIFVWDEDIGVEDFSPERYARKAM